MFRMTTTMKMDLRLRSRREIYMSYPSRRIAYFVTRPGRLVKYGESLNSSIRIAGAYASRLKHVKKLQGLTHH
ncbi:Uncharacterized protein HZ326_3892 [Fusarium oxysporum f. sp. albedinis]|nr:Uncharacterized protein HZ326_3892 [Fusarium oxysporum f. sp. albedinis]